MVTVASFAGLPQSILAHGVLLSDKELHHMARTGAAIAHCPLSNFFFADRILRWARGGQRRCSSFPYS